MYRSENVFGPNGTSLRAKTAKGYDDKGPTGPRCPPAGRANFSEQLTNPCIYDMSTNTNYNNNNYNKNSSNKHKNNNKNNNKSINKDNNNNNNIKTKKIL